MQNFSVDDYSWPAFQGRVPFAHQKATAAFLIANKRAFVLNEQGTAKTLSALWACDILMTAKKIFRVLIVCPLSTMKAVWVNEILMNVPHRSYVVAHGQREARIKAIHSGAEFVIINHDGVRLLEDELIKANFDILLIDELTAFKSHSSDRSKSMERIARKMRAVWGMTGELTPNSPVEAFFPCKIVNPFNKWLPRYFTQFRGACMTQVNDFVWIPKPEAPQIVSMCAQPAIRYTRDQCLDLPDTMYQTLEIPLTTEQKLYYDTMRKQAYLESDSGSVSAVNAGVMLNKLLQISAGAVRNDDGNVIEIGCKDRIDMLLQIFDETPQRKLVVFATFRATIQMLEREMAKHGIECASIHGDIPQNLRATLIDRFQRETLQVLILQPQSSAHGITLTASSTIVWFSLVASNELFQQGNARIVRPGQTRKTTIYLLVGTNAEKHIAKILQRKGDLSAETKRLFSNHEL